MTNSQVAARLRMSPHTVDSRLRRVFAKLGANTRVELTTWSDLPAGNGISKGS